MRICIILVLGLLSLQGFSQSKEKLTNASIITLHKAGIGKEVLIAKIKASDCVFDLSTEKLVQLKKSGVPDDVVTAMLSKEITVEDSTKLSTDRFSDLASGIYYEDTAQALIELEPAVFSQTKQSSGILRSITYGIAKDKQKSTLSGTRANLQIGSTRPTFYFVFDKSSSGNLSNNTGWFSAATSPNEFILVKLTLSKNKQSREVITGTYNDYQGLSTGIDDAQKTSFSFEKISKGLYKVTFLQSLEEGEYCFVYAGSVNVYGSSGGYKVFDFSISN